MLFHTIEEEVKTKPIKNKRANQEAMKQAIDDMYEELDINLSVFLYEQAILNL